MIIPDPNSNDLRHRVVEAYKAKAAPRLLLPLEADDAAAVCLSMLSNPEAELVPAEAWEALARQNDALKTAPKLAIQKALARQATLVEAAGLRYMARAAATSNPSHAAALMSISLGCSKALVSLLGAINQLAEQDRDAKALSQ